MYWKDAEDDHNEDILLSKGNITFTPGPHVLFPPEGFTVDSLSILVVAIGIVSLAISIFICAFVIRLNRKVNLFELVCLEEKIVSRCRRGKTSWRGRSRG